MIHITYAAAADIPLTTPTSGQGDAVVPASCPFACQSFSATPHSCSDIRGLEVAHWDKGLGEMEH